MSTFSVSTALAHGVLSSSSAWAIWETKDYVFAPIGFLLYFINGVLGLIAYGVADCVRVHKLHKAILLSGLSLSLPLFSSQLYVEQFITSPGHRTIAASTMMPLVVHMAPLLAQVTFLRHLSPSPLHAIYLASLVYISLYKGYYYGVTTAASLLIALYLIGPSGMVFSVPSRVLFNYALSFSVYFLVQTFHGSSYEEDVICIQNKLHEAYLPLVAAQVAAESGALWTSVVLFGSGALAMFEISSVKHHIKSVAFFVIVFQWNVLSPLWWTFVALIYAAFFLIDAFFHAEAKNLKNVRLMFIYAANLCLVMLLKTQSNSSTI